MEGVDKGRNGRFEGGGRGKKEERLINSSSTHELTYRPAVGDEPLLEVALICYKIFFSPTDYRSVSRSSIPSSHSSCFYFENENLFFLSSSSHLLIISSCRP